ncbi:MAG: DUF6639 family protein [Burkholderiaceae bacterium]
MIRLPPSLHGTFSCKPIKPHKLSPLSLLAIGCAALAFLQAAPAHGKQLQCAVQSVTVYAVSERDAADSCRAAADALRFLASQGLDIPSDITIRIVDKMPETVPESALGAYAREKKEIVVLAYSALERGNHSFNTALNHSLYRAVVSHEVAHAVAAGNFTQKPSCLAQEYIAYVTFFTTMEEDVRESILRQFPPGEDWQIHAPVSYFLNSLEYGAHAYRHFLKPENGQKFIRRILDGEVLCDFE